MLPPLLADVNVAVEVVEFLRSEGVDVLTVAESGWAGLRDAEILERSVAMRRFVLTHDGDFGRLAVPDGLPYHGILRLRPGDNLPAAVVESLRKLLAEDIDWTPPMIAVYRPGRLRVRRPGRHLPGGR